MPRNDLLHKIKTITYASDVLDPFAYADLLVKENIIPADKKAEAAAIVLTTPTALFLYEGARLLVDKILQSGSDIVLWTQGEPQIQRAKCDTSKLLELGDKTHGTISALCESDKITTIGNVLTNQALEGKNRVVIIDDKSYQLMRAYQAVLKLIEVEKRAIPADIEYIWMRSNERSNKRLPTGFETLAELNDFMGNRLNDTARLENVPVYAQTLYLLDFDHTLFDTDKWFETVQERIVSEVGSDS